MLYNLDY